MSRTRFPLHAAAAIAALALVAACTSTRFDGPDGDRRFYEARCGLCHVPFAREGYSAAEWDDILDEMGPRAGLTRPQRARVLGWLTAR
jgi:hypothetical protein